MPAMPTTPCRTSSSSQRSGGPPVRGPRRRVAHGVAGDPDLVAATLGVLVVPAGVADLRRGGDHDLAVIAGVGQRLLVARHAGGEHRLAERLADRAERCAGEDPAVLEDQQLPCYSRQPPPPQPLRVIRAVRRRGIRCRSRCPTAAATGSPGCPSWVRALPAIPRSVRMAVIDSSGIQIGRRTAALQHDALGIAGQHRLGAVAEVADGDAVLPARRQRAADVQALGRRDDGRLRRCPASAAASPISSACRSARCRQPRTIAWTTSPITTASTAADDQRPDQRAGIHAGAIFRRAR